ncbi:L-asparaginase II [Crossiella equi]|uniref:L-asparaginase II n=1 Tax=Crossiella equi TaxID=130796 RepID=A0ABS5AGY6_9PSEU|nr:asparaginase [Crossiella equi]MBP2475843.1 L-asparaginase II [Crossiella equi]
MSTELVEVVRSGFRECVHRGSVVIVRPDGVLRHVRGDGRHVILPRSSSKPFQVLGGLRCGLDLPDDVDVALAAGSHNGEPEQVARVRAILAKHGLSEDDLLCPPDLPIHPASADAVLATGGKAERVTMNCSGKHAAMLATCVQRGWSTSDYLDPSHPLQVTIRDTTAELGEEAVTVTAVDGCGAPQFGMSLRAMARAFGRLAQAAEGTHEHRVAAAMRAHPYFVAGTGREDTLLMEAVPGLLSKAGAEGVYGAALPDGTAIALKIDDGHHRARLPVMVGALRFLGVDTPGLAELAEETIKGGGRPVGSARLLPGVF